MVANAALAARQDVVDQLGRLIHSIWSDLPRLAPGEVAELTLHLVVDPLPLKPALSDGSDRILSSLPYSFERLLLRNTEITLIPPLGRRCRRRLELVAEIVQQWQSGYRRTGDARDYTGLIVVSP